MTVYQYGIADGSSIAHGTGTLSVSGASKNVTGSGTAFTTELSVHAVIVCAGQTLSVASITDNDHLVLHLAAGAAISTQSFDYFPVTNVESLSTTPLKAPKSTYRPYFEAVALANGQARGFGRPIAVWRWGFLTRAQRDRIRLFCTCKSASVYISTRTNEADAYSVFSGVMLWPDDEDKQAGRRLNFEIEFRNLVEL